MQLLPNLVGNIVFIRPLDRVITVEAFLCVNQTEDYISVVSLKGGVASDCRALSLRAWEVTGYYRDDSVTESLLTSIFSVLDDKDFTLTEIGRTDLLDSKRIVTAVLQAAINEAVTRERVNRDRATADSRTIEDEARAKFFESLVPETEPVKGATFAEQAYGDSEAVRVFVGLDVGTKVNISIIVDHPDPAVVQRVTEIVRRKLA